MTTPGSPPYDFLIIGAGVIGCALARELARFNLRVGVVEQYHDVGDGTSKANSGILHTGFDAKPGTLESRLVREGRELWQAAAPALGVPIDPVGAVMLAVTDEQVGLLDGLLATARKNGGTDVQMLTRDEVCARVPAANPAVQRGLWVPRESLTCTFTTVIALAEHAAVNGVQFHFGRRVTAIERDADGYRVRAEGDEFRTRWLVISGGLWSDDLARMTGRDDFTITPRKGEFLVLDKSARAQVPHILLPVPTPISKGILVAPTINGNVLMGPTADDIEDKRDLGVTADGLRRVRSGALQLAPGLADEPVVATYAGLRTAGASNYLIEVDPAKQIVLAAGIRSTGLSSALAVAREISGRLAEAGVTLREKAEGMQPRPTRAWMAGQPRPCLDAERVAQNPAYGYIICQCESVSEGEIIEALHSPLGIISLDAIKKRTWANTGRCQGFYCTAATLQIMARETDLPLDALTKRGPGSELLAPVASQKGN
ncbi:MAG: NAD(P)/FAD-dependent oxidoreductase [Chloroflexi bacterium]|nr:NAD(P)/FAD-dependent oxidoreductase [Chloroflexota bacterium]